MANNIQTEFRIEPQHNRANYKIDTMDNNLKFKSFKVQTMFFRDK